MAILTGGLRLNAAVNSMHQFLPIVRTIFPAATRDDVVEATTFYLYAEMAESIFGVRFARRLRSRMRQRFKFASPVDIETRICRIARNLEIFEEAAAAVALEPLSSHDQFTQHVRAVVRALAVEAGLPPEDNDVVREIFPRFEFAVRRVKEHLIGIKRQSGFVMR